MNIVITGCCGFIGSHLVGVLKGAGHKIIGIDCLVDQYSANRYNEIHNAFVEFYPQDISCPVRVNDFDIDVIINMAGETFVDNSIEDAEAFIDTNIKGTWQMLELARTKKVKKFIQISTDEVYGSTTIDGKFFEEGERLCPGNPYSATKAGADMMCMAYSNTFDVPICIVRPENNYGIRQSPEKAIPTWVSCALQGKPMPVYGDGHHERMWLHVQDCCHAIEKVVNEGVIGEIYNIGGMDQRKNLDVVQDIRGLIEIESGVIGIPDNVARPGHDRAYAVDTHKIRGLGWKPVKIFEDEILVIVEWYRANQSWQK